MAIKYTCNATVEVKNPPWPERAHDLCKSRTEHIVRLMRIANDIAGYEHHQSLFEALEQQIQEMPLSVRIRSGWTEPGKELNPGEYEILLSAGGPAIRIIGELDEHQQPATAFMEAQDWFEPWTYGYRPRPFEQEMLLSFVNSFYFGA